jgi:hypothetical protein
MRLPRVPIVPLLLSIWTAPGVAQAPQTTPPLALPNPFATQPLPGNRIPSPSSFAQNPNAKEGSIRGLNPGTLERLNPFVYRPNALYAMEAPQGRVTIMTPRTLVAHNDERCYAIRDYRFSRVAPESDATRLSGSSTCEPAGQVRLKGAAAQAR